MITIGICDDEEIYRKYIKELCERYFGEYVQEHEYIEFKSGVEVLAYKGNKMHLLFLDVEMNGMDGLEVMKRVEDADWIWRIVFVSNHEEAVWNSFSIKTLEFARKPIEYRQVKRWIEAAKRENQENTMFEFDTADDCIYKKIEEIYYLKGAGNYTQLHGKKEEWLINHNLKKCQNIMEHVSIIRIHKSYLVNMSHIRKWDSESIIMENGEELPLGRQFAKQAKEAYYAFARKQAMGRI